MSSNTINMKTKLNLIIVLLLFVSCKNHTKTEEKIDKSVYAMWADFTKANPEFKTEDMPESWFFHNNKEDANRLAELIINGKKKAGSGLYQWYKDAKAELPKTNVKHIITDFDGKAKAIIKVIKVDTIPFNKISEEYAKIDMGTDIKPLEKWKKAHWTFFKTSLEESNKKPTEDMLVVCETYKIIWTKNHQ